MKKFMIIMVVQFTAIITTTKAIAQSASSANNSKRSIHFNYSQAKSVETSASVYPVVSERINQKFLKEFSGVTDAKWARDKDGYAVHFTLNGIQHKAFLNKHGYRTSLIRYYSEEAMPFDVRHLVKSTYYDYAITLVTEVHYDRAVAYLVTIADKTTWKVIRVQDGEMNVRESYIKG